MDTVKLFNKRGNSHDELEVILSRSKDTATSLIKAYTNFSISKSLDLWNKRDRMRINLITNEIESVRKEVVSAESLPLGKDLTINLKSETPINNFNKRGVDKVRIKYSQNYDIVSKNKWRLDISRVLSFDKLTLATPFITMLKEAKDFDDPKLRSFSNYEVELECLDSIADYDDMIKVISDILSIVNEKIKGYSALEYLGKIFYQCFNKRSPLDLKSLLPSVKTLDRVTYQLVYNNMDDYYVTEKTDGFRCVLIGLDNKVYLLSDVVNKISECESVTKEFILDGELCDDVIYIFDCLQFGDTLCKSTYPERLGYAKSAIDFVQQTMDVCKYDFKLKMKNILPLSKEAIKQVYETKYDYKIDGLIFTPKNEIYFNNSLKWKPIENLTIDFLVIKAKSAFHLYVGISRRDYDSMGIFKNLDMGKIPVLVAYKNYFPIPFSTIRNPLLYIFNTDDKEVINELSKPCIAEFRQKVVNNKLMGWEFLHVRKDRQERLDQGTLFGNDYKTAERVMEQYYIPLNYEDLLDFKDSHYFVKEKSALHKANTRINGQIKKDIFALGSGNLIDIGAGKGQNMQEYKNHFTNVLAIDKDNLALSEMITRLRTTEGSVNLEVLNADIMHADLSKYKGWANMVTINFAIHYMIQSLVDMLKLYNIVNMVLREGYFAFTCLNGKKVLEALKQNHIEYFENGVLKYAIKLVTKDKEITLNKVEVLLPFSNNKYYEEHLVDVDKVINTFTKKGYELVTSDGFSKYLDNPKFGASEVDKLYGQFNHYVILKKTL